MNRLETLRETVALLLQGFGDTVNAWLGVFDTAGGAITLEWPAVLLLAPLPLLARLLPEARNWHAALHVHFFEPLRELAASGRIRLGNPLLTAGVVLIWLLLLVSTARPVWLGEAVQLQTEGREMMLAVDISGSMQTRDMLINNRPVSRIFAVKAVAREFIARRQGDRMGLILFGSRPYLQMPLSFDLKTLEILLSEAQLGFAGQQTAIGDAIALAVKRLRDRPAENRVLILLTDGSNTSGEFEPRQAAQLAATEGLRIHTIGIGADRVPYRGFARSLIRNRELDEKTLREISEIGGGRYFRARNPQQLKQIYRELDALEPLPQEEEIYRPHTSLYHWPLGAALLLSFLLALYPALSTLRAHTLRLYALLGPSATPDAPAEDEHHPTKTAFDPGTRR